MDRANVGPDSLDDREFQKWASKQGYSYSGNGKYYTDPEDAMNASIPQSMIGPFDYRFRLKGPAISKQQVLAAYAQSQRDTMQLQGMQNAMAYQKAAMSENSPEQQYVRQQMVLANQTAAPGQDIYSQRLAQMMTSGFTPDDPSYQWRMQQGQLALERSAAAKGMLGSGGLAAALTDYGQKTGAQEYAAQFGRLLQGASLANDQFKSIYGNLGNALQIYQQGQQVAQGWGTQAQNWNRVTLGQGELGVQQGQLGVQQGQLGLANRKQSFAEETAKNQDLGAAQALQDRQSYLANLARPTTSSGYDSSSGSNSYTYYPVPTQSTSGGSYGYVQNNSTGSSTTFNQGQSQYTPAFSAPTAASSPTDAGSTYFEYDQ